MVGVGGGGGDGVGTGADCFCSLCTSGTFFQRYGRLILTSGGGNELGPAVSVSALTPALEEAAKGLEFPFLEGLLLPP